MADHHLHHARIEDSGDYTTSITIYERSKTSALDVVRKILGLRWHNHSQNPANEREQGYRDSGLWWSVREKNGSLTFYVQVGCSCSHDCCGHLCGLRYNLRALDDQYLILITYQSFNY
jgi:hypothetical protein